MGILILRFHKLVWEFRLVSNVYAPCSEVSLSNEKCPLTLVVVGDKDPPYCEAPSEEGAS